MSKNSKKLKILILTDHKTHTINNSFYALANALLKNKSIKKVFIASKGEDRNKDFFSGKSTHFYGVRLKEKTNFNKFPKIAEKAKLYQLTYKKFNAVLLRLPRPIHPDFFPFLEANFPPDRIVNKPSGILKTGNKAFLLEVSEFTPPIRLINNLDDLISLKSDHSTVLKPLEEYGGKGLIRVDGERVFLGNSDPISFDNFEAMYAKDPIPYLAMKFLKNVKNGDKRIVVADGKVLTSSTRYPAEGSWLCNVAQGGNAEISGITKEEEKIIDAINPILKKEGIFLYGLDTLEDDDGKRVISEINTLSVGGIAPGMEASGKPLDKIFAKQLVHYLKEK